MRIEVWRVELKSSTNTNTEIVFVRASNARTAEKKSIAIERRKGKHGLKNPYCLSAAFHAYVEM